MIEYLSKPEVAITISTIGFVLTVFGAIASFFGIKSYFGQRKTENAYKYLLEKANQEWKGKYSEEEVEKLNREFEYLTAQINNELPKQARLMFLKYKHDSIVNELDNLYKEYATINEEIKTLSEIKHLDDKIEQLILDERQFTKTNYPKNIGILIIILLLVFLSMPFTNHVIYYYFDKLVGISGANLTASHITSYFMLLSVVVYVLSLINIKRFNIIIRKYKGLSLILSFLMILMACILIYFISFDIFIVTLFRQIVVGIISIILLASSIKVMSILYKYKNI